MKKLFLILSIAIGLNGCSSIELDAVPSSKQVTQRILNLGLSHEENLVEASKLSSAHMVSVVTLQLTNARDEKIQADKDLKESEDFATMVTILQNNTQFISSEISESSNNVILDTDKDLINYFIEGFKDQNNGIVTHKLNISITYNSKNRRDYYVISFCDKWNNCEQSELEVYVTSANAANCNNNACDFTEIMEIELSDEFLKDAIDKGFSMRVISNKKTNKITLSKPYLMGYLRVAQ
jgi:hypothetical protein